MVLVLTDAEVARAATWREKIDALQEAFADWGAGRALSAGRVDHHILLGDAAPALLDFRFMFGVLPRRRVAALRIVNATWCFPGGTGGSRAVLDVTGDRAVPAFVLVLSAETGRVEAVLPDAVLQRDRVVCTGAVGVRLLARAGADTLGLIGSGNMAAGYLRAIGSDRALARVLVYSPDRDRRRRFAQDSARSTGIDTRAVDTAEEAASADIVCLATNARHPVVESAWFGPGTHVAATNLHELPEDLLGAAGNLVITCQDRPDGWEFSGACLPGQADRITALLGGTWSPSWTRREGRSRPRPGGAAARVASAPDLGDLLSERVPARTDDAQITYHLNQSASLQFPAVAWVTLRGARESGLGTELPDGLFTTMPPGELPVQPLDPVRTRRTHL